MSTNNKIVKCLDEFISSVRVLRHNVGCPKLQSRVDNKGTINILGTGPSLTDSLSVLLSSGVSDSFMVLNDFAVSPKFQAVKPEFYIFKDPAYFLPDNIISERDKENREKVFHVINEIEWDMTVIIPSIYYNKDFLEYFSGNQQISILPINTLQIEYVNTAKYYKRLNKNLIAPIGNNILGLAIYAAIQLGFKEVNIFGAEHSWTKDIRVNNQNQVCTIYKHFFENDSELVPWRKAGVDEVFKMHEILKLLSNTFEGYYVIEKYAKLNHVNVYNYTPDSFVDAFERKVLEL